MEKVRDFVDIVKKWFGVLLDQIVEWTGWFINSTFGWYTGKPIDPVLATWLVWGGIIGITVAAIFLWKFFGASLED